MPQNGPAAYYCYKWHTIATAGILLQLLAYSMILLLLLAYYILLVRCVILAFTSVRERVKNPSHGKNLLRGGEGGVSPFPLTFFRKVFGNKPSREEDNPLFRFLENSPIGAKDDFFWQNIFRFPPI